MSDGEIKNRSPYAFERITRRNACREVTRVLRLFGVTVVLRNPIFVISLSFNGTTAIKTKEEMRLNIRNPTYREYLFLRFPVPGDCGRLITCVDGNPRLLTCGDGKLFDSVSLSCLDPDELPHWYVTNFIVSLTFIFIFSMKVRMKITENIIYEEL